MFQISDDMATVIGRRNVDKVRQFLKHFLSLLMMFRQKSKFFFYFARLWSEPRIFYKFLFYFLSLYARATAAQIIKLDYSTI
jgi:hypothetical protein